MMFTEELYNGMPEDDVVKTAYLLTLSYWLIIREEIVFDNLLKDYEKKEMFAICQGIMQANTFIDEKTNQRLEEVMGSDASMYSDPKVHKRVQRLIIKDVIEEIYERNIRGFESYD
jgi:hypothetical protein